MDHAKNVRSPSLIGGNNYIMKSWGKTHTYSEVKFLGFTSNGIEFKSPNKQLRDMLANDFYKFSGTDGTYFKGVMVDSCLVHEETEARITFFDVVGASTVVKATKPVKTDNAEPVEAPVVDADADVAPAEAKVEEVVETAQERKRRIENEKKRAKRAADKAAKEAAAATVTANETTDNASNADVDADVEVKVESTETDSDVDDVKVDDEEEVVAESTTSAETTGSNEDDFGVIPELSTTDKPSANV